MLNEARLRHEINDVIQGVLLVLNASHCSLPCAKWYVHQLGGLLRKEGKRKVSMQAVNECNMINQSLTSIYTYFGKDTFSMFVSFAFR